MKTEVIGAVRATWPTPGHNIPTLSAVKGGLMTARIADSYGCRATYDFIFRFTSSALDSCISFSEWQL
jgi:hypothetical protein